MNQVRISQVQTNLPLRKRKFYNSCGQEKILDSTKSIDFPRFFFAKKKKSDDHQDPDVLTSFDDLKFQKRKARTERCAPKFPEKLMTILSDNRNVGSISWVPDENLFFFVNPKKFVEKVLPLYFRKTKFESFTRRLSRWGFIKLKKGPRAGCFYHRLFQQSNKELCKHIISPSMSSNDFVDNESSSLLLKNSSFKVIQDKKNDLAYNNYFSHGMHSFPTRDFKLFSKTKLKTHKAMKHDYHHNMEIVPENQSYANHNDFKSVTVKMINQIIENQILRSCSMVSRNLIGKSIMDNDSSNINYTTPCETLKSGERIYSKLILEELSRSPIYRDCHFTKKNNPFPNRRLQNTILMKCLLQGPRPQNSLAFSSKDMTIPKFHSDEILRQAVHVLYNS